MLSEEEGCRVLEGAFRRRGYVIERSVAFREGSLSFEVDGWDASQRVGFEYLTRGDGDHDDLDAREMAALATRIEAGELYLLIIDESQVEDADELLFAAERFLDEVERRRGVVPRQPATRPTMPTPKRPKTAPKKSANKAPKKRANKATKKTASKATKKTANKAKTANKTKTTKKAKTASKAKKKKTANKAKATHKAERRTAQTTAGAGPKRKRAAKAGRR